MTWFSLVLAVLLGVPLPQARFDSGIVQVERYGNATARPLVLVPGLACGPWVWSAQIHALAAKYDLYVLSLPGFDGRSMIGGDDLMKRVVASLHELIVSHHLKRPIVVGHSLGGTIAVLFGETYPHDAANIVTVEGGYPVAPTQAERNAYVARRVALYGGISQNQLGEALRKNMLQYTITRTSDVDRATILAGRSEPEGIVDWIRAGLTIDLTPRLARITVPFTAIIPFDAQIDPYNGFKTAADKQAAYTAWVAHTARGKVMLITGSRHFVMIDRPRAFESALEAAIAR